MGPFFFSKHRPTLTGRQLLFGLACLHFLFSYSTVAQAETDSELWARLQAGGYVLLMQHASALPAGQRANDLRPEACGQDDELSDQGLLEASRLRDMLQRQHVSVGRVLTSRDCRCIQTAGIVFGRAEPWSIIDDAENDSASRVEEKSAALREAVRRWWSNENLVLISHRSTYQNAFGVHPGRAQLLVFEPLGDDGYRLLGRLNTD
jgi:phosphohistidine phosphatase SixA